MMDSDALDLQATSDTVVIKLRCCFCWCCRWSGGLVVVAAPAPAGWDDDHAPLNDRLFGRDKTHPSPPPPANSVDDK
jgi:hypothetical protein